MGGNHQSSFFNIVNDTYSASRQSPRKYVSNSHTTRKQVDRPYYPNILMSQMSMSDNILVAVTKYIVTIIML